MTDLSGPRQPLFEDRLAHENSAAVAEAVDAAAQAVSEAHEVHTAAEGNPAAAVKPAAARTTEAKSSGTGKKEKKEMKDKKADKDKKQLLLRLSPRLWEELAGWAEDDFRSINGQIEYLLTECVHQRHKRSSQKYDD